MEPVKLLVEADEQASAIAQDQARTLPLDLPTADLDRVRRGIVLHFLSGARDDPPRRLLLDHPDSLTAAIPRHRRVRHLYTVAPFQFLMHAHQIPTTTSVQFS